MRHYTKIEDNKEYTLYSTLRASAQLQTAERLLYEFLSLRDSVKELEAANKGGKHAQLVSVGESAMYAMQEELRHRIALSYLVVEKPKPAPSETE